MTSLTGWKVEIVDYHLAAIRVIDNPVVVLAVEKAIKQMVHATKGKVDIPGVKVTRDK